MAPFNFITVRLGKDSIPDIQKICASKVGVLDNTFTINVKCTQIPDDYGDGDYAFLWLGSNNNKGMPTPWKQGFKAVGRVKNVNRSLSYNDTSETTIDILYIFHEAVNRMDILRCAPIAYYWCSSMPLIGLDDHANQTIRNMIGSSFSDIRAFFFAIESVTNRFKDDIIKIEPAFIEYFDVVLPNPQTYPLAKNLEETPVTNKKDKHTLQQIFYGAPGTGKSHEIKKNTKGKSVIRTTFHPDSDYSTFVGCYKPSVGTGRVYGAQGPLTENGKPIEEPKITYRYVMQAFLKAYLGAWKKYADRNDEICEPQFLVIEEINRGNCAQIFGDLFQLLDRDENGFSEYPIEADTDLQLEIERAFKEEKEYKLINDIDVEGVVENYTSNYDSTLSEDVQHGRVLLLPKNLYIWATMNTSDQSLFPIDSAFKRRWDWEYMPIGYKNDNWTIEIGEKKYKWVDFQHKINGKIYDVDNSEDKQLGDYFVNADRTGNKISAETLLNKILFYLWNDVCKDDPDQIFKWVDDGDNKEKSIKFSEFFCGEDERNRKLQGFMAFLKVIAIGESQARTSEPSQSTEEAETNDATAEIMK